MLKALCTFVGSAMLLVACGGSSNPGNGAGATAGGSGGSAGSGGADAGSPKPTSDELDALPDIVYLKTNTQSFNRMYYLAVLKGDLWVKPNVESTGTDGPWTKMTVPAAIQGRVSQVSIDDHGAVLFDQDRKLTWTMSDALNAPWVPNWITAWGAPLAMGPGFNLPDGVLKWEYSVLTVAEDDYWVDPAGNQQKVGLGTVAHIWILHEDRQRITLVDPILPVDLSYEMCGPLRGRFKSENLSASASTTFVLNQFGDMFTRLYDFDISGADTLFFKYSYEDQTGVPLPVIQLPAPQWVKQPKIDGTITDRITIFKTGKGSDSRMLRVEGLDGDGNTGFYEKAITAQNTGDWVFHRTDLPLRGNVLDNSLEDRSESALGDAEDRPYGRNLAAIGNLDPSGDIVTDADWAAEIGNFNLYCSPATFTVHVGPSSHVDLILHTVDSIRQSPRARGLDSNPYALQGTIEVPQALLDTLATQEPKIRSFITSYLGAKRFTAVALSATQDKLTFSDFGWVFDYGAMP
jgi:hypothetical protein